MNMDHFYFTNPRYVYSHFCIRDGGVYKIFENMTNDGEKVPRAAIATGTPVSTGRTVEEAISSAEGIKHYMVKLLDSLEVCADE